MHIHILGICGTFMGGIAALAKAAGHRVTGSDQNVYPPMSTQLEALGIDLTQGFDAAQLDPAPDVLVVGNVMTRGHPVIEEMLERGLAYASGPQWLAQQVLRGRWVLAVAGTHGKTTTSSLLAWILEYAQLQPGFLIGGVAENFGVSARLGQSPFFVIEADEYDTAFFDKRAKFVHYGPRTLILNNLEFDHADIYADLAAIQKQFQHLLRVVPGSGRIVVNGADEALAETLQKGCWTPIERFAVEPAADRQWSARLIGNRDGSAFEVLCEQRVAGTVEWSQLGLHNVDNALAAIAAARHAGVPIEIACKALAGFVGVKRRLELRGRAAGVTVYDDFAHHPTAIRTTVDALRRRAGTARIIAVLEPRSHTMRLGVHRETLGPSLAQADRVWLYLPKDLGWSADRMIEQLGDKLSAKADLEQLLAALLSDLRDGDQVLIMSNGGFGNLHARLLEALRQRDGQVSSGSTQ